MYSLLITSSRKPRNETPYNPTDIDQHRGKVYTTRNRTEYQFKHCDGSFHGEKSLNGVMPELVAGIHPRHEKRLGRIFSEGSREKLRVFMKKYGEAVTAGKYLVLCLSSDDAEEIGTIGFKTGSRLEGLI